MGRSSRSRRIRWPAPPDGWRALAIAVKDLIDTAGLRTSYGACVFEDHVPRFDAAIVTELRGAGAAVVGKANLNAFGVTGHNPHYGTIVNPRDPVRTAGGSSGGAAAAVAKGACDAAVGTDTSGSIRIPAACRNVYGFKAAHGAFDTTGVFPLAPSYDSLGYLAPDVATLARLLDVAPADYVAGARVAVLDEASRSRRCRTSTGRCFARRPRPHTTPVRGSATAVTCG